MTKRNETTVINGVCQCCGRDYIGSSHDDVKDGPCPSEDCPSHDDPTDHGQFGVAA